MAGFQHPPELAGMAVGVVLWVTIFAGVSSWGLRSGGFTCAQVVGSVKTAAWIKLTITLVGLPALFSARFLPGPLGVLAAGLSCDMVLGMAALAAVAAVGRFSGFEEVARADSAGWTALATIIDGALMAVLIVLIASVVMAWRQRGPGSRARRLLSPIRKPD